MKRLIPVLVMLGIGGLAASAMAYNYHNATTLICSDCHTAHASQSHDNNATGTFKNVAMGALKPYDDLLRNEPNELCLTCHDNNANAPDVLGDNNGKYPGIIRQAGALNEAGLGDAGYEAGHGHTIGYTGAVPGSNPVITIGGDGLECVNCHSQHGSKTQYRNLLNRNVTLQGGGAASFSGKTLSYATLDTTTAAVAATKVAVIETADLSYAQVDIKFGEPSTTASMYANWCKTCHSDFHGSGGATNMGGASGGFVLSNTAWKRHPTADVNIGGAVTDSMTHVSSLAQYATYYNAGEGHFPKVMDSQGLWTGAYNKTTRTGDNTVTPSCFSCHKGHGNKNDFGLIFMGGGATPNEEGDGGSFRTMCRGCHSQGSS